MSTNLDRFKADLAKLTSAGDEMALDLMLRGLGREKKLEKDLDEAAKKVQGKFEEKYQSWYSEATAVIKQLLPDRLNEFTHLYQGNGRRKAVDVITYNIQDWLNGVRAAQDRTGKNGPSGISGGDACSVNRVFAGLHACFVGQSSGPGYRSKPPQWK